MEQFDSKFLLFVSSVREVKLRVLGDEGLQTSHISRDLGVACSRSSAPTAVAMSGLFGTRCMLPRLLQGKKWARQFRAIRSR